MSATPTELAEQAKQIADVVGRSQFTMRTNVGLSSLSVAVEFLAAAVIELAKETNGTLQA